MDSEAEDLQYYEAIFTLALRKSCNALKQLLDVPINHAKARVSICRPLDLMSLLEDSEDITSIYLGFNGSENTKPENRVISLTGHLALCFNQESVRTIVDIMSNGLVVPKDRQSDLDRSCVNEVGNIFSSHLLSTISNIGMYRLMPSTPTYMRGPSGDVVECLLDIIGRTEHSLVFIETVISAADNPLVGKFLIFPRDIDDFRKLI